MGNEKSSVAYFLKQRGFQLTVVETKMDPHQFAFGTFDFVVSQGYRFILKPQILIQLKRPALNLHISLLPFNRGADPNFWSWFEGSPKGVTLHEIDEGIDTGPIYGFCEVKEFGRKPTLATSYALLQEVGSRMFQSIFPFIENGEAITKPQPSEGSFHRTADLDPLRHLLRKDDWHTPVETIENAGKLFRSTEGR